MKTIKLQMVFLAAGVICSAATAKADLTFGEIWSLAPSDNFSATLANIPGRAADYTFSDNNSLNFDSRGGLGDATFYTIADWLATGGATLLTGNGGDTIDQTIMRITGQVTVTSGESFTVAHDDGLSLFIDGVDIFGGLAAGPTPPTVTTATYSGPSGTFAFTLIYAEVDGPPGVLRVDLPLSSVPEASTWIAGSLLLLPFGVSTIRKFRGQSRMI